MSDLLKLEGVSEQHSIKLRDAGIQTIERLRDEAKTPLRQREIAKRLRVNEKWVQKWVNHANFYRIKGIARHKAELLEASGVPTLKDLARTDPVKLYDIMVQVNQKKNLVQRVPGLVQIERWVNTAKTLTKKS